MDNQETERSYASINGVCEDYPCCGHTDGLGCNWTPDTDSIWRSLDGDYDSYYELG